MGTTEKPETTTILVTREVRDFIDSKGLRNETFDEILRRILGISCDCQIINGMEVQGNNCPCFHGKAD